MATELAYALITPHSLRKSRTGGILSRLLSRTGLELVYARMLAPDQAFSEAYADFMAGERPSEVREEMRPLPGSQTSLALVYRGRDAVRKIREILGPTDPAKAPQARSAGSSARPS